MNMPPEVTQDMKRHAAWLALEERALEPSPVATWAFAGTASEALPERRRPTLIFTEGKDGGLTGAFPLLFERWRWRPFGRVATSMWGDMDFLGVPLLHAGHAHEAIEDLFTLLRLSGVSALEFRHVPADGAFFAALKEVLAKEGLEPVVLHRWWRAVLDATRKAEDWWREDISSRHRSEWRRRKRRLAERGELVFERLEKTADVMPWLEEFMELEKSGWKGKTGTALACQPHTREFALRAVPAFHARGRLEFFRLRLDGRTIASTFGFVQRGVAWMVKIAFDESLHRFSPGGLLVIELTEAFMADPHVHLVDSCAAPDHPLVSHVWREKREMLDVLAPLPHTGRARFAIIGRLERGYRRARARAAQLADKLRQRRKRLQRRRQQAAPGTRKQ